jgi:hypothetical protein
MTARAEFVHGTFIVDEVIKLQGKILFQEGKEEAR